jgi:hypothetical protein
MRTSVRAFACAVLVAAAVPALAQLRLPAQKPAPGKPAAAPPAAAPAAAEAPADPLDKYLLSMFKQHGGITLCAEGDGSLRTIRAGLAQQLRETGAGTNPTIDEVATALWTRFPCPFHPGRSFRAATASDIEGVWLFPEASQPYRYGPRSPNQPGTPAVAIRCEIVGYYPGGEYRTGAARGVETCPFRSAADLEEARKRAAVAKWSLLREGRVGITRTDVAGHVEEWDVHVAMEDLVGENLSIERGDLVAFLRKERGNEINAATEFRHLRRLR